MNDEAERPLVIAVDDDELQLSALRRMLLVAGFVPETYLSGAEMLAQASLDRAGCVLLDAFMPHMSGLETQVCLKQRAAGLPIIFLSGCAEIPIAVAAMREGAADFVEKPFENTDLVRRIRRAIDGRGRLQHEELQKHDVLHKLQTLTPRECSVLEIVVTGKTSKEIARILGGSHRTIEIHRRNIMEKMAADTLADLVRMRLLVSSDVLPQ